MAGEIKEAWGMGHGAWGARRQGVVLKNMLPA